MQYDDGGDHSDFWGDDQPTRQLRRVQPGKRSHDHTGSIPVVAAQARRGLDVLGARAVRATAPDADATQPLRRVEPVQRLPRNTTPLRNMSMVDPLFRRISMVVAAIIVLIPVAIALRSEPQAQLESVTAPTIGEVAAAVPALPAATAAESPAVNPADLPVLTVPATPAPSFYVAAELPPAVPSVTQPAATEAAPTATTVAAAAAPAATATTVAVVAAAEGSGATCSKTYVVVRGDFWIGIAKRAQVTLKELLKANNAKSSTKLFPGRNICLPKNAVTPVPAAQPAAAQATTTTVKATAPKPAPAPAPATTVKPTPTTTPAASAPANSYSREQVVQIIREVWPDDLEDEAIRIATRESSLKPTVRNYCCFGLFQIYYSVHKRWLADLGITSAEMLYDPRANANAALALYVRAGGWGPWKL
jgi:LysM repeat protein